MNYLMLKCIDIFDIEHSSCFILDDRQKELNKHFGINIFLFSSRKGVLPLSTIVLKDNILVVKEGSILILRNMILCVRTSAWVNRKLSAYSSIKQLYSAEKLILENPIMLRFFIQNKIKPCNFCDYLLGFVFSI